MKNTIIKPIHIEDGQRIARHMPKTDYCQAIIERFFSYRYLEDTTITNATLQTSIPKQCYVRFMHMYDNR